MIFNINEEVFNKDSINKNSSQQSNLLGSKHLLEGPSTPLENNIKEVDISKMHTNHADNQGERISSENTESSAELSYGGEFNNSRVPSQEEMERFKAAPAGSELNDKY
jgi:hypothetical protein